MSKAETSAKTPRKKSGPRCPICRKPAAPAFKPFCSTRCADVDLGRWLSGRYVVPGEDGDAAEQLAKGAPMDSTKEDD